MKTLVIAGAKGGTGKTTTAINLSAEFAVAGHRVLLQDFDPQASATLALGALPADPWSSETVSLHPSGISPDRLTVAPGGRALAAAGPTDIQQLLELPDPAEFDIRVIDTPPSLGALVSAPIDVADTILVPVEPTPLALPAFGDVAALIRHTTAEPPPIRAVLVRVHPQRLLTGDVTDRLSALHPLALYSTEVPEDVRAAEAPGFGVPLRSHAPLCRAAGAYHDLAREVAVDLGLRMRRVPA